MDFLGYKITYGQILFTFILGLITATIYNKIVSPYLSKIFDILSEFTNTTTKWRIKKLLKNVEFYKMLEDDFSLRVTYQNGINSEMIALSSFCIFCFCFFILLLFSTDIYQVALQASISKKVEIADLITSVFGKDKILNYEITKYKILSWIVLSISACCLFRVFHLFSKSYEIAFIDVNIESLDSRIAKLKHRLK